MKTKLAPIWYAVGSIFVIPVAAIFFAVISGMLIIAWPIIPFFCYFVRAEEVDKTQS